MLNETPPALPQVYSVSDLTAYIRAVLESNENLAGIWVAGELSNLSRPSSGHIYFTLKDAKASMRCVVWREQARYLAGVLRDGMAVEAHGSVGVYEQGGQYQLYVDGLRAAGEGLLYQEFLRLKARLEEEGLFDEDRKRSLPPLPQTIGVVTSPSGAAFQDILNTLKARYPLAHVVLAPAVVQGDAAPAQIVKAIEILNCYAGPDVIILARGGGSLEDLWAFNDERVVRAVAASQAPVVSGVGHETDFTLADFVADVRAPTPTGAAVLAAPDITDLQAELGGWRYSLEQTARAALEEKRSAVAEYRRRLDALSPRWQVRQGMQRLDDLGLRLAAGMAGYLRAEAARLKAHAGRLAALDPHAVLRRGYALVRAADGALVASVMQVKLGQIVNVAVSDGSFDSSVQRINPQEEP